MRDMKSAASPTSACRGRDRPRNATSAFISVSGKSAKGGIPLAGTPVRITAVRSAAVRFCKAPQDGRPVFAAIGIGPVAVGAAALEGGAALWNLGGGDTYGGTNKNRPTDHKRANRHH